MMDKKNKIYFAEEIDNNENDFLPIFTDDDIELANPSQLASEIAILPLRNTVLFPGVVIPITIGRDRSLQLIKESYENDKLIGTVSQIDKKIDSPKEKDLYRIGTSAKVIKILELPDNTTTAIIHGQSRFKIQEFTQTEPYFKANVEHLKESTPDEKDTEFQAIANTLKDLSIEIINLSQNIPNEASFAIKNIEKPLFLINYICTNNNSNAAKKQELLEIEDIRERAIKVLEILVANVQELKIKNDIQAKVKSQMDSQQREFILSQQMKTIQSELGQSPIDLEINELKEKAKTKKWDEATKAVFEKEISKVERTNPASPEFSNQINYLQTLLDLPWNEYTKDIFDLNRAEKILDRDHFGLEKVKDRILEHLAVLKLKGDLKSPIICLYGPPGVGKTSLGKSVAEALGRKYIRMALGGLHDESEIRGHRKTYIGAMPGRIIQNIIKAKSSNPVFILDEIDKIGNDFRGDPSFALLEVLDPEQNNTFYDNYLEHEYDLSKVMFIATANTIGSIKPALRDRMEMINVTGYILEEKAEIAKRHLIPKQLKNHGIKKNQLKLSKNDLELVIEEYTRESGVRELDKKLAKIARNIAKSIGFEQKYNPKLNTEDILRILGPAEYQKDKYQDNETAGVVTGLAWTSVGGAILYVETSLSKGNGNLTLTGNLGNVMKESAILALEYIKSHSTALEINAEILENYNIHVHVPEGAIPKDGPSAGVTMVSSMASALTQRKIRNQLAMTGEITLRGLVLPVGGIKEKILAAKRANIKEIILSKRNEKDVQIIKDIYIKGLKFYYVETISEMLDIALLKQKVKNPRKFRHIKK